MSLEFDAIYNDTEILKNKKFITMKNDIIKKFMIKSNNVMMF